MAILGFEVQALPMPGQGNAGPRVTAVRPTTGRYSTGRPTGTRSGPMAITAVRSTIGRYSTGLPTGTRSIGRPTAACFSAPGTQLRSGSRLIPNCAAPDTPPPPPEEPLPKRPGKPSEFLRKALSELKSNALAVILLISCTVVGYMAAKDNAKAVYLVNICEKSEKVHKFLSHLVPLLTAIWKCFK